MHLLVVFLLVLVLSPSIAHTHNSCPKAKCEVTRQKIEKIQAKMRQGYTRAQGEKMEAQLRSLRAIKSKHCR